MPQLSITQLPTAGTLTGSESVPIVQNGVTVQTTTGQIAGAASLNYPFVTFGSTAGLTQARQLTAATGISLVDGGIGNALQITLTGAALSLDSSPVGLQVKTAANTVTGRAIEVGTGLTITNANGVDGDPTIGLNTFLQQFISLTGTGMLAIQSGAPVKVTLQGVTSQTSISNGDGAANPVIGLANNAILPGTGSVTLPQGSSAQRLGSAGAVRYNTSLQQFEGLTNTGWNQLSLTGGVTSFSGGTTGLTPNSDTTGAVTLGGTLSVNNGGTGATGLVGYVYGNGTNIMSASTTIPTTALSGTITNAQLLNSAVTFNGVSVSLGGSGTITATASNALTIGTGLTGTSYNGSAPVTIAIDSTVATLTGSQTLTNKTISGSSNTLTNIANASLTNSSVTVGTTNIALGATSLTLAGLTSVTVTQDPTQALQLATKQYVDNIAQGLNAKQPVVCATTANITLSGEQTIDGVTTSSSRVLVKNQSTQSQNGIYVSAAGAWTRALDADTWNELVSAYVWVSQGTINGDTGWVCTVDAGGTLGVTAVTWVQFSGAGTYTAGTGLTLTGTQFSITNTTVTASSYGSASSVATFTVNAQGQLTLAATTAIAIAASQVTSGTLAVAQGGTNIASYTIGDMLYASGATTLSKLALGTTNYVMTAGATAPQYVAQSTLSVGSATNATNATNTGITAATTGATNYLTFVTATSGNLPQLVNSSITCNAANGTITGGIAGGAF
jgi:hypothetical protein